MIARAFSLAQRLQELRRQYPGVATAAMLADSLCEPLDCPLLESGICLVLADRPRRCRYWGLAGGEEQDREISQAMASLSQETFLSLTGRTPPVEALRFSSADTISGKFVQLYFQAMTGGNR